MQVTIDSDIPLSIEKCSKVMFELCGYVWYEKVKIIIRKETQNRIGRRIALHKSKGGSMVFIRTSYINISYEMII